MSAGTVIYYTRKKMISVVLAFAKKYNLDNHLNASEFPEVTNLCDDGIDIPNAFILDYHGISYRGSLIVVLVNPSQELLSKHSGLYEYEFADQKIWSDINCE